MSIYGILIGLGIVVAIELIKRKEDIFSYKDISLILIVSLLGARTLFLLHNIQEIQNSEINVFNIQDGGLALYGAISGLLISIYVISIYKKQKYLYLSDRILLFLPLIQSIGRIGNFFNHELYGKPTTLPWAIYIPLEYRDIEYAQFTTFHPVFLYESILNIISFLILLYIGKRYNKLGLITGIYLILYPIIRLLLNTLRLDKEYFLFIETSDLLSILFLISGILILISVMNEKNKNKIASFFSKTVFLSLLLTSILTTLLVIDLNFSNRVLLFTLTLLIPSVILLISKRVGLISDFNVTKREERLRIYPFLLISFFLALIVALNTKDNTLISMYYILNITFFFGFLITLFFKISFHMICSVLAIFFVILLSNTTYTYILLPLLPFIGWSRIELKKHSLSQTIAGILLPLLCISLVLTLNIF